MLQHNEHIQPTVNIIEIRLIIIFAFIIFYLEDSYEDMFLWLGSFGVRQIYSDRNNYYDFITLKTKLGSDYITR